MTPYLLLCSAAGSAQLRPEEFPMRAETPGVPPGRAAQIPCASGPSRSHSSPRRATFQSTSVCPHTQDVSRRRPSAACPREAVAGSSGPLCSQRSAAFVARATWFPACLQKIEPNEFPSGLTPLRGNAGSAAIAPDLFGCSSGTQNPFCPQAATSLNGRNTAACSDPDHRLARSLKSNM